MTYNIKLLYSRQNAESDLHGTLEGTFLYQYLPEERLKQKELEKKSKQ